MHEMRKKITDLAEKKRQLESKLVAPARAAANQMKDAGMNLGADPLLQILFEIDAVEQEMQSLFKNEPDAAMEALLEMLRGGRER